MECSTTPYRSAPLNERQGARRGREPGAAASRARQEVGSEELDALRQRQLAGVVDRVRGLPHIGLPRVGAGFASAAGLLLAAEGTADLRSRGADVDRKSTRLNSSHVAISYAVFCLKKKK